ncbi:NAD(P)/FAD-dependent oxidoreductase [Gordonia oryzae]|uniref:NAD(P)/FAD-dependent oxidoreductase n=1 Tax=Gordonia oryzae TaxID=2487349 RepID=A0A3N4GIN3_9ACTN|nr:NAD(P)/FAD-dependent oxidoreductase [Gordonia oryzae]RPA59031.1 NAD(P)/FAD-dependent oxidoreductase [Gordonia oryzae]
MTPTPRQEKREPEIVIIGAGIAGITMAYTLQGAGYSRFRVLEKGSDVGGVWYWNRYPGLTCDVPSQLYQFGFAPKADWSSIWAPGPEIQRYHRDVVDKFGLDEHIQLNTTVVSADFDDASALWTVVTDTGETILADFVICATGVLHNPAYPNIPGLAEFKGKVVHTARWDESLDVDGARIAVIGTGSTGVQVVSALQQPARSLTHFVRSPQWVLWAPMHLRQPKLVSRILERSPGLHAWIYAMSLKASAVLPDVILNDTWRRRAVQKYARLCLRRQVQDRQLRESLTPDYEPLCKRQVVSGTYYRALRSANTELVTTDIARVTEEGIQTVDGREFPLDIIVLATGFRAHDYMRPMRITGREGRQLDEIWADGPRAYRMTAIPGLPNLFTVLGPNSPTGSISLQYSAEVTSRYILSWLDKFRVGEISTTEVTEEATEEFNREVNSAAKTTVWNSGCNSWYFTDSGNIDLWPFTRSKLTEMLTQPNESHFRVTRRQEEREAAGGINLASQRKG